MWTDTSYQTVHFIFVFILAGFWSLLFIFGKSESSFLNKLLTLLSIGGGFTVLGLGMSWLISDAPILELAIIQKYETTLGFIRLYLAGLSILLAIPVVIIGKMLSKILQVAGFK